jgi:V8-like Glu-specific endopeptidase
MELRTAILTGLTTVSTLAFAAKTDVGIKVIYGTDDRVNVVDSTNDVARRVADSTVALFSTSALNINKKKSMVALPLRHNGQSRGLCKSEPFWNEYAGAFCSGTLVGDDLVLTAGHCISTSSCPNVSVAFNFRVDAAGTTPRSLPTSDVYKCGKIVSRVNEARGLDYAVVKLDRPVEGYRPAAITRAPSVAEGSSLFVVGHPSGLPTKIADNAEIRSNTPKSYFVANLDTYGGNSGSGVFDSSGLLVGVLVRGENDYVQKGNCRVSQVCPTTGCMGEEITRAELAAPFIP